MAAAALDLRLEAESSAARCRELEEEVRRKEEKMREMEQEMEELRLEQERRAGWEQESRRREEEEEEKSNTLGTSEEVVQGPMDCSSTTSDVRKEDLFAEREEGVG
eukprot:462136-Hanusia_phi.AAC.1